MKASFITGIRSAKVREIDDAHPQQPDEALIRVAHAGICGTDLELYDGTSNYLRRGLTEYPHHYGHEWVGVIETPPQTVHGTELKPGAVVTGSTMIPCLICDFCQRGRRNLCTNLREVGLYKHGGAAAQKLVMPAHVLTVIDDGPGAEPHPEYILIEPLVTVLEGLAKATPEPGDRVLVLGGGTIGTLAALVLKQYPVEVAVVDPSQPVHLAELGVTTYKSADALPAGDWDAVWECSGSAAALQATPSLLRNGGAAVLIGFPPAQTCLDASELALRGQYLVGVRHGIDHYAAAAQFVREHRDELGALIDSSYSLDDAQAAFERLEAGERERPKVMLSIDK